LDATVGAYQSKETYWVRIKEFWWWEYKWNWAHREVSPFSLGGGVINADCQKWSRVQKTVDEINPSGYGEFDRVSCVLVDVFICQAFSNMFVPNLFSSLCL
jgi:hypothetical protein